MNGCRHQKHISIQNKMHFGYNGQSGLQKRSSVPTCPPSKTCTPPESGNGQGKSLQTPHILDLTYFNFSPLVGATEHCSPKPQTQKPFLPPRRLTNEQLTHCDTVQSPWITKTTTEIG